MCVPMIGLLGGVISGIGSMAAASAQANAANANAAYMDRQAIIERQKADYEARRAEDRAKNLRGKQIAMAGASGLEAEGAIGEVLIDTQNQQSLDVQAIRYGGEVNATNFEYKASIERMNASNYQTAGMFNAASGAIGAFTKLSPQFTYQV